LPSVEAVVVAEVLVVVVVAGGGVVVADVLSAVLVCVSVVSGNRPTAQLLNIKVLSRAAAQCFMRMVRSFLDPTAE